MPELHHYVACWRGLLQSILEMVGLGANIGSVPLDLVPEEEMRGALEEVLPLLHALSKNVIQQEIMQGSCSSVH